MLTRMRGTSLDSNYLLLLKAGFGGKCRSHWSSRDAHTCAIVV